MECKGQLGAETKVVRVWGGDEDLALYGDAGCPACQRKSHNSLREGYSTSLSIHRV